MKLSPFSAWNAILFMYPPTHRFVSIYHRFALFFPSTPVDAPRRWLEEGFIDAANLLSGNWICESLPLRSPAPPSPRSQFANISLCFIEWESKAGDIYVCAVEEARYLCIRWENLWSNMDEAKSSIPPCIDFYLLVIPWFCLFAKWIYVNISIAESGASVGGGGCQI